MLYMVSQNLVEIRSGNGLVRNGLIFNQNMMVFIPENIFENVTCKMLAILSRPWHVQHWSHKYSWVLKSYSKQQCLFSVNQSHHHGDTGSAPCGVQGKRDLTNCEYFTGLSFTHTEARDGRFKEHLICNQVHAMGIYVFSRYQKCMKLIVNGKSTHNDTQKVNGYQEEHVLLQIFIRSWVCNHISQCYEEIKFVRPGSVLHWEN